MVLFIELTCRKAERERTVWQIWKPPFFTKVDCISLYVDDLDAGIRFYSETLGLKLLWRAGESCGLGLPEDVTEVVLCTSRNPMVDFKVDSVPAALERFVASGGICEHGPFDIDIGKCAVVCDRWGNRYCILDLSKGTYDTDDQGNVVSVTQKD